MHCPNLLKERDNCSAGFTLIELLIVIVIIGILAGVLIAVINPVQQQTKANQTVLRANVDKLCLATTSCAVSHITNVTTACDTFVETGANDPSGTPTGATYTINVAGSVLQTQGTLSGCIFRCDYDTSTGASVATRVVSAAGSCLIE